MRRGKGSWGLDYFYPDFHPGNIDNINVQFAFQQYMYSLTGRSLMDNSFSFRIVFKRILKVFKKIFLHFLRKIPEQRYFKDIGYVHQYRFSVGNVYTKLRTFPTQTNHHFAINMRGFMFNDSQPQSCQLPLLPPFTISIVEVPNIVEYPADSLTSFMICQST